MKKTIIAISLGLGLVSAQAAIKPCDELKKEVAAKLDEKGVKGYKLDVVDADKAGDAKVVGSCNAGKNKLVYEKSK